MKNLILFLLFNSLILLNSCVNKNYDFGKQIDTLIDNNKEKPFNGIVLISQSGKPIYTKIFGYSNLEKKTELELSDQFVIGSISKQVTSVLVLQTYEKGLITEV